MDKHENSAERLFSILSELKKLPRDKKLVRDAFSQVFNIDAGDTSKILLIQSDLIKLSQNVKETISSQEDMGSAVYKKPFKKIEAILSKLTLDSQWAVHSDQLDETTLYGLEVCADILLKKNKNCKLTEDQISDFLREIEKITEKLINSTIPDNLKEVFIKNLENIRKTILTYKINGIDGIQPAIEQSYGTLVTYKKALSTLDKNDTSTIIDFVKFCDHINKGILTARNVTELISPLAPYFIKLIGW